MPGWIRGKGSSRRTLINQGPVGVTWSFDSSEMAAEQVGQTRAVE
jgi:hypothetical protein